MNGKSIRVLIFTDSLALARSTPEICSHQSTWPELLKREGHMVHQVSIGGATTTDILNQVHYHLSFNPDVVILQAGIVDCAPRFMSKVELGVCRRIPFVGKPIIQLMNTANIRKLRNLTYVSKTTFESNVSKIIRFFDGIPVLILGIISATDEYEKQLPGVGENIIAYNKILGKFDNFMTMQEVDRSCLMSDFHHINAKGHEVIFRKISSYLQPEKCLE